MKALLKYLRPAAPLFDLIFSPLTFLGIAWFRIIRYWGIKRMPVSQKLFLRMGMLPVVDHYYEPLIDYRKWPLAATRSRLDLNEKGQREFIQHFNFQQELDAFPLKRAGHNQFYYHNGSFGSGDAELYYSVIRYYKPSRIVEVGSGFSTLVALAALANNRKEDIRSGCEMVCIEPFEMPFLEETGVRLIRQRVEEVDQAIFAKLGPGDVLFVDSSHIIRPGGDVNFLILNVLPSLHRDVLIHFHDIFIPDHYPVEWLRDEYRLWNEQYLLEAFLVSNESFEIVFGMAYMNTYHRADIVSRFPVLEKETSMKPGSMWLRKIR